MALVKCVSGGGGDFHIIKHSIHSTQRFWQRLRFLEPGDRLTVVPRELRVLVLVRVQILCNESTCWHYPLLNRGARSREHHQLSLLIILAIGITSTRGRRSPWLPPATRVSPLYTPDSRSRLTNRTFTYYLYQYSIHYASRCLLRVEYPRPRSTWNVECI